MSDENRIHFWEPETISDGDLVWIYDGALVGPLLVDHQGFSGYGSNKKLIYMLLDTSSGEWYSSEKKWIRVPMEVTCD